MRKKVINTANAPEAAGPYSQAVSAGGFVFVSGQIPAEPETGKITDGGIEKQAERVIKNLTAVLAAWGLSLSDVVKTTVYLKNMSDFSPVNEVYSRYFASPYPARSCVEAKLPKDALIEIEAVAAKR
ncbi:MAG: RidA family protein [Christensenellales bacterium]